MLWGFLSLDNTGTGFVFCYAGHHHNNYFLFQFDWREKLKLRDVFESIRQFKVPAVAKINLLVCIFV